MIRSAFTLFLFVLLLAGCKTKSSDEVDPQYLGVYEPVQYSETVVIDPTFVLSNFQSRGKLTVSRGGSADEILLDIDFPERKETLTAVRSGAGFRVTSKTKDEIQVGMNKLTADYQATIEFTSANEIIVRMTSRVAQSQTSFTKSASYAGTKKA